MHHSIRRRLLGPILGAGMLLVVAASPAAAMTQVSISGCDASGGIRHITPDFVYLKAGWLAETKGEILAFEKSISWNVTVNGTPVDVTPFIADPVKNDAGLWSLWFYFPAGQLTFGETMTASVEYFLTRPVFDGVDRFPAGSFGTFECTIQADVP